MCWCGFILVDYGEQVYCVVECFVIFEVVLVIGVLIIGWSEQVSCDVIQYSFNVWVKEFGIGNKEYQQIIEQCEVFLNVYGLSCFVLLFYDFFSMLICDLVGY